jgi:hypothetical protein
LGLRLGFNGKGADGIPEVEPLLKRPT